MASDRDTFIISGMRTPMGSFLGKLKDVPAAKLGAEAIKSALGQAGIKGDQVDEVFMGNVLMAGQGQAPGRQASLYAGIPDSVSANTINKMCGSGMKAVMWAEQAIRAGDLDISVAGGMESMSRAPYLVEKGREGFRMGHVQVKDSMIADGLWDVYNDKHMGSCAELCAKERDISRQAQDDYAVESYKKAQAAVKEGKFKAEIVAVPVPQRKGDPVMVSEDEEPFQGDVGKLGSLRPAFEKDGTVTAGNASTINDGAAALVLASGKAVKEKNLKPRARIVGHANGGREPVWFTMAPSIAIRNLLKKTGWKVEDVDLWELNEAFAVVALGNLSELKIDPKKCNVNGGAVALGHPIGASGARIIVTLLNAMEARNAKKGIASLCIGGGEGVALAIERS
ncbi:MAG: acetyl-CoA C-acetyltransferase [Bdellovibrionota bacterium]